VIRVSRVVSHGVKTQKHAAASTVASATLFDLHGLKSQKSMAWPPEGARAIRRWNATVTAVRA